MNFDNERSFILNQLLDSNNFNFDELALSIYFFQKKYNPTYSLFLDLIGKTNYIPSNCSQIPFLPIDFFKKYNLKSGEWTEKKIFESSATTSSTPSRHFVRDPNFYLRNILLGFEKFYGHPKNYTFFGLLPSYLERENSSLIFMVDYLIKISGQENGGFFLNDFNSLIKALKNSKKQIFLIGVSFALMDLCSQFELDLQSAIVMETGGMKGRRKELIRQELHGFLQDKLNVKNIHSEYGMTELYSQAYSKKDGLFFPTNYFKVFPRDLTDPLSTGNFNTTCGLNFIDLFNFDTVSFISSEDLGKVYSDGSFEVLGRIDQSDIRGCNLMVS